MNINESWKLNSVILDKISVSSLIRDDKQRKKDLTWVLKSEVRFRLSVLLVNDLLADVLRQDLIEDIVDRQGEAWIVIIEKWS